MTTDQIQVADYTEITVVRPDGTTEVVRREGGMGERMFAEIRKATKAAGKGDAQSYKVVMRTATIDGYSAAITAERKDDAARAAIYGAMDHAAEKRAGNKA